MADADPVAKQTLRVLTVDVPGLLRCSRSQQILNNSEFLFEVHAQVFAIHEGSLVSEKYVLLRSMDTKPVIRAYYYTVEPLTFRVGDTVRCLGSINRTNQRFQALSIRAIDYAEHRGSISRLEVVSNFVITNLFP